MEEKKVSMDEIVQSEGWKKFMNKLELGSALMLLVVIVMTIIGQKGNNLNFLFTIALTTFAATSFFMSYNKFESESKVLSKVFFKIYGLGLSIGFITVMFAIQKWWFPIDLFSIVASILIIISLALGLREISTENKNNINWTYFLRIAIALVPLIILMIRRNI